MTNSRFKQLLYLICGLTDFSGFVVVFAVSRGMAEQHAEPWYLGVAGGGLSFSMAVASLLSGWLSHRFDSRAVIVAGTIMMGVSAAACASGDPASVWFLPRYWLLGAGLGCVYPTLIGWLNRGDDAHANRRGVSRTLILFCVSWNAGMMCGQLTAGSLFALGPEWTFGAALAVAAINVILVIIATRHVPGAHKVVADQPDDDSVEGATRNAPGTSSQYAAIAVNFKRLSWIANLGGMFGGSLVFHLLPDLAVTIGIAADNHGSLLACWRAVIVAVYLLMHISGFWHFRFSTSLASQILGAIGLVLIAQATSAVSLFVGLTLLGQLVGYNYFSGLFYSTAGSSQEHRTLAAGIHEATLAAGMAIGTIAGGLIGTMVGHRQPYLLAAVAILVLAGVQFVCWWKWMSPIRQKQLATVTDG